MPFIVKEKGVPDSSPCLNTGVSSGKNTMTVYEELTQASGIKPENLDPKSINKFLLRLVNHVSDSTKFSDAEWSKLSFEAQSYINACITVLDNSTASEEDVVLEYPDGFILIQVPETAPAPEKKVVSEKKVPEKNVAPEKKRGPIPVKNRAKHKTAPTNQNIDFDAIMDVVWQNPEITKGEFIAAFPQVKRSTLVLYRSILLRAVEHFKTHKFFDKRKCQLPHG